MDQCTTRAGRCMWDAGQLHALAAAPPVAAFRGDEGALASSGFIIVGRQTFGSELRSTLAHELFHVLEFAHNMEGLSSAGWHWFTEASAKWAEWYFVPESRAETVYPWFDEYQSSSRGLESTAGNNEYASYLWPYHMEQERRAGAIQAAWVAIDGKRDHRSITAAIDGKLPFAESYRKLAVRAWNETLRPGNAYDKRLQDLDRTLPELLPGGRRISATGLLPANAPGTPPRRIPESIESLYSRYGQFQVHDDVGQVTFDFGKLDPRDALDVDALLKIKGKGWEHRAWPNGKVRLCTNDPDDDAEEIIVVLSNHDIDPRLYIEGEWTVESLKEPCSGWEVEITWTDEYAGIKDTITLQGSIDTLDAEAPGDGAFLVGEGTASGRRAGWKACNPGIEVVPAGSVRAEFGAQVIGDSVTISGWAGFDTPLSGVVTGGFTVPVEGGETTIEPGPLVGDLCPHRSFGSIEVTWFERR